MNHELLAGVTLFSGLDDEGLQRLAELAEERGAAENEIVFQYGDPADSLFVVLDGRVVIYRDAPGHPVQLLGHVGGGESFGELSLLGEESRKSSAKAVEPCRLLVFQRRHLQRFLEDRPAFALRVQITAAQRHQRNAAAALDLGRQGEVRIRLGYAAEIVVRDGVRYPVRVENLSPGGVALGGAPANWIEGRDVPLHLVAGGLELKVPSRVSWREGDQIGLSFVDRSPHIERSVYRLIHALTGEEEAPPAGGEPGAPLPG